MRIIGCVYCYLLVFNFNTIFWIWCWENGKMSQLGLGTRHNIVRRYECGQGPMRSRGSGFPQRRCIELHAREAGQIDGFVSLSSRSQRISETRSDAASRPTTATERGSFRFQRTRHAAHTGPYKWVKNSLPNLAMRFPFLELSSVTGALSGQKKRFFRSVFTLSH